MNDLEKLRVMLPHWIGHNQGHGGEFAQWAEKITSDSPEVAQLLRDAVQSLQEAQSSLEEALEKAGGPLEEPGGPSGHGTQGHDHSHEHGHHHQHS
ncbi:MAG: hypothetical protein WGN25_03925 [Candidatus Electrothrix sp. GW3-4]|uniref:hypothetical protein n=1 Tax=Candidatus Electrothrix sp. GW3-4 TaxID=3126740 RepID=UPI0030CF6A82